MVRSSWSHEPTDNVLHDDDARDDDHSEYESHDKWQT